MEAMEVYEKQMGLRTRLLADPEFMRSVVTGYMNLKAAFRIQKNDSGQERGVLPPNVADNLTNMIFPTLLQTILDIQVDFLPNNVLDNVQDELRSLKAQVSENATRKPESQSEAKEEGKG